MTTTDTPPLRATFRSSGRARRSIGLFGVVLAAAGLLTSCHASNDPPFNYVGSAVSHQDRTQFCAQNFNAMPLVGHGHFLDLHVFPITPDTNRYAFVLRVDTLESTSSAVRSDRLLAAGHQLTFAAAPDSMVFLKEDFGPVRQAITWATETQVREILDAGAIEVEIPSDSGTKIIPCAFGCRERMRGFFQLVGPDAGENACWYRGRPGFVPDDPALAVLRNFSPW